MSGEATQVADHRAQHLACTFFSSFNFLNWYGLLHRCVSIKFWPNVTIREIIPWYSKRPHLFPSASVSASVFRRSYRFQSLNGCHPPDEVFGDGMINHLNKLGSLGNGAVWLLYLSSLIGVTYRAKMSDSEKHKGYGYNAKSYPTTNLKKKE